MKAKSRFKIFVVCLVMPLTRIICPFIKDLATSFSFSALLFAFLSVLHYSFLLSVSFVIIRDDLRE